MQFSRTFVTLALAVSVLASPHIKRSEGVCSTGSLQCCNSVQPAGSKAASSALGDLIDVIVQGLDVPIGLDCTPISVIGAGSGGNCAATPVCCDSVHQKGLVNINCLPIVAQL